MNNNACRVCGLITGEPPYGLDGASPEFWFCPCCGVEHGYGDATPTGAKRWRRQWLEAGGKWHEPAEMPATWQLDEQLENVPADFR
jgi:hypothetical protein